jgi:hypothetical protein
MKLIILAPFILASAILATYIGIQNRENAFSVLAFVFGSLLASVGLPLGLAVIAIGSSKIDYSKKRFQIFVTIWTFLFVSNVFVTFWGK